MFDKLLAKPLQGSITGQHSTLPGVEFSHETTYSKYDDEIEQLEQRANAAREAEASSQSEWFDKN